jgi:hypothetical protein
MKKLLAYLFGTKQDREFLQQLIDELQTAIDNHAAAGGL